MFEDSLVESSGRLAARHPGTTALSFACQSIALAFLLLFSLLYTESLPTQRWIDVLQAPPSPPAAGPAHVVATPRVHSLSNSSGLVVPSEVPKHIVISREDVGLPLVAPAITSSSPGSTPVRMPGNVLDMMKPSAPPPKALVQELRVSSGVAQGLLLHQVKPQYPAPARLAGVEGRVILQALIGKDGEIENLRVVSGHPLLAPAAVGAVKQWRYEPYLLNGEPVEVETQIVVNFSLPHE